MTTQTIIEIIVVALSGVLISTTLLILYVQSIIKHK